MQGGKVEGRVESLGKTRRRMEQGRGAQIQQWVGSRLGRGVGEPPTLEAIWLEGPAFGEHRQQRLFAEEQLADHAVAAPEPASAPRARPQFKAAQDDRVPTRARGSAQPNPNPGSAPA